MIYVDGGAKLRTLVKPGSRILDVGCGTGKTVDAYRTGMVDVDIYGVDGFHDPAEVQPFIRYTKQDIDGVPLPYEDAFFDVVVLNHILEHVHRPVMLVDEARRVLRPDGLVYIETPSVRSTFVPDMRFANEQFAAANFYDDFTHVGRPQTFHSLYHLLSRNGFDVQELDYARPKNWVRAGLRFVASGLKNHNRVVFCTGIWHLVGWSLYAIARKNSGRAVPSHV